jgi:hypothetical protein
MADLRIDAAEPQLERLSRHRARFLIDARHEHDRAVRRFARTVEEQPVPVR